MNQAPSSGDSSLHNSPERAATAMTAFCAGTCIQFQGSRAQEEQGLRGQKNTLWSSLGAPPASKTFSFMTAVMRSKKSRSSAGTSTAAAALSVPLLGAFCNRMCTANGSLPQSSSLFARDVQQIGMPLSPMLINAFFMNGYVFVCGTAYHACLACDRNSQPFKHGVPQVRIQHTSRGPASAP